MKRLHVHVGVDDLPRSIGFYSTLFGAVPTVAEADYAKWMLDDPRVNFAISAGRHAGTGIEHLGIQVKTADELGEVYARLQASEAPVLDEGAATCCYALGEGVDRRSAGRRLGDFPDSRSRDQLRRIARAFRSVGGFRKCCRRRVLRSGTAVRNPGCSGLLLSP